MDIEALDIAVVAILGLAAARGFTRGLIRETFSVASLAGAVVAVVVLAGPLGEWITSKTEGDVTPGASPWLAGLIVGMATIAVVVILGRFVRRGSRWAGLGWADRAAGALVGGAEGAVIASLLVLGIRGVVGSEHPSISEARAYAILEQVRDFAESPPDFGDFDVAAPPPE
jgi:membrane protein required for colicin V production